MRQKNIFNEKSGPESFGVFIRGARASLNLTQVEMAKKMGISKSTLCDIEMGRQLVSVALAVKIAKRCGLSELIAVQATIQDQLCKADLKFKVKMMA
ncbi:MAG: helix-turn-helix transcriptional regulator [Oligoflexia bacterium]|nr:helix-turn-helix transcriptional regulator [Oligoflexia bacterium]